MNILMVGAGAVGVVYGHYFANAGHKVTFLVKDKYQQALENEKRTGIILYHLNNDKELKKPQYFKDFETITDWDQTHFFDIVALAISSNALRQLPLELINQNLQSSKADLLMLQPSATDFKHLSQVIPEESIFKGMINLVSYQTNDVNNSITPAGIAYYLPPMPMPISSSTNDKNTHLSKIVSLFKDSGIPAKAVTNAIDESRLPSTFIMTFLCALEAANWEFKRLGNSPVLLQKLSAAQQVLLPAQIDNSIVASLLKMILKPTLYKLLLKMTPWFVPFPLEAYLKKHFLKLRSQTVIYMQEYTETYHNKAIADLNQLLHNDSSDSSEVME
ncbi:MAG: hypothetical protein KBT75_09890 [Oleispira antarctica]|uniref:Ketopantoate reductase n=1 Tax=Oleispira antarctica RB-8 TaxID=698738 RepID=R4YQH8_OLEAN|nr:hypothetical protein [Oleispira antarctica]MBQ0792901.1 hypothetical protein [Oleispira antarctica]CCK75478.1 Ketopantoate reductase [Oleispira antarctica RB-8]